MARRFPVFKSASTADTVVVPMSTARAHSGEVSSAANTSSSVKTPPSKVPTQRMEKPLSRSTWGSFTRAGNVCTTRSAPSCAWMARLIRSLSGMVSSKVGSSTDTISSVSAGVKSIPAARTSANSFSKIAISSPDDRSAVFILL